MPIQIEGREFLVRLKHWFTEDDDRVIRFGICLFIAICAALLKVA